MTIDELNALTTLTAADEVPVWDSEESGEPTKKITAQNMANSVKTLANLQGALTFDTTPTTGSTNPVTSGGVADAITQSTAPTIINATKGNNIGDFVVQAILCGKILVVSYYMVCTGAIARQDVLATFDLPSAFIRNCFNGAGFNVNLAVSTKQMRADTAFNSGTVLSGQVIGVIT